KLADGCNLPTVVVTHHLPHPDSIPAKYAALRVNAGFASDLTSLLGPAISLWIHGHTHDSCDYFANGTRIVCNPRGYLPQHPNPGLDPALVWELSPRPMWRLPLPVRDIAAQPALAVQ